MSTVHEGKLTELRERVAVIDEDIARLDNEFAKLAGGFDVGDQSSLKAAAIIEQRISRLRSEKALSLAAQGRIAEQQQQEQLQAELDEKRRLLLQAKQHADLAVQANVEIDRALVNLRELFARRAVALHALASSGVVEATIINKLMTKPCATRAACFARLQTIISIESTAPTSFAPLSSSNPLLLGIGASLAAPPNSVPTDPPQGLVEATKPCGNDSTPPPERPHVERRLPRNGNGGG
jgi:hypothetical protein